MFSANCTNNKYKSRNQRFNFYMECTTKAVANISVSYFTSVCVVILLNCRHWSRREQHIFYRWPDWRCKSDKVLQVHGIPDHPRLQRSGGVDSLPGADQHPQNSGKLRLFSIAWEGKGFKKLKSKTIQVSEHVLRHSDMLLPIESHRITVNLSFVFYRKEQRTRDGNTGAATAN